jgi:hypothetical protein
VAIAENRATSASSTVDVALRIGNLRGGFRRSRPL